MYWVRLVRTYYFVDPALGTEQIRLLERPMILVTIQDVDRVNPAGIVITIFGVREEFRYKVCSGEKTNL